MTWAFALLLVISGCAVAPAPESQRRLEVISYLVRDRVVPLEQIEVWSTIIVGFRAVPSIDDAEGMRVEGKLYHDGKLIATDEIHYLDSSAGNLGFDLKLSNGDVTPEKVYRIPDGMYEIVIALHNREHQLEAEAKIELAGNEIMRTFRDPEGINGALRYIYVGNHKRDSGEVSRDIAAGLCSQGEYEVFQKNPLENVFNGTVPDDNDCIASIKTELSLDEFRSLTFSIRALKNLGKVSVYTSPIKGGGGVLEFSKMTIRPLRELTDIMKKDVRNKTIYYDHVPKIVDDVEVAIPQHHTQTYWMTLKVSDNAIPAKYAGHLVIVPENGTKRKIPVEITVLPFSLGDTDIQFGMMMDYAFYELDNRSWMDEERALIKKNGDAIYRNLREHGMTVAYPHSHFVYRTDERGEPIMESLRASLDSYTRNAFPGPFVWYLGHLLQTAKTKHPGSILGYDEAVAQRRLRDLLLRFESLASEYGIPKEKLIVQLIDEPDSDQKERMRAGKQLYKIAHEMGFKTLITRPWSDVDFICTFDTNNPEAQRLKETGKQWWLYPNTALSGRNLAYSRYVFGFGAWKRGVDGVVPWTFQMSQGGNGNPFTVLDGPEVMVAYPGVEGPIPTPTWEVVREGINDYKYIFMLRKLILRSKARGNPLAFDIEGKLNTMKDNVGEGPGHNEGEFGAWPPHVFDQRRQQIVDWALQLYENDRSILQ